MVQTRTAKDKQNRESAAEKPSAPDLAAFLDNEVLPRLKAEDLYTHESHQWHKTPGKWRGGCPWHESKSGTSFYVQTDSLLWRCPGCQIGGGPVQYLHRLAGGTGASPRGQEFVAIVRKLAAMAGVPFPERELTEDERELARKREARRAILTTVLAHCEVALWSEAGNAARAYLHERGFTDDQIRDLGLGLYDDRGAVLKAIKAGGHDPTLAREVGVLAEKWPGYITFPWNDEHGRPLSIYGTWSSWTPPEGTPKKYALHNPKDKAGVVWENCKRVPLYADRARKAGHKDWVLVEGLTDAALAQAHGDARVVACVAAELSYGQAAALARLKVQSLTIALDPDSAGDAGILSCIRTLARVGITAYVAPKLPDDLDPDELIRQRGMSAWRAHIKAAIHAYRYQARLLIRTHKPADGWSDQLRDDAIAAAVQFASNLPAEQDDELLRHYWPEILLDTGSHREAILARVRARRGQKGNGKHAAEPPPAGWEDPVPFTEFPRPAFPVEHLPPAFQDFVRALAEAAQVPPDLPAMLILGVAGAALAKKFRVCARDGWVEPTNVYTVTALDPGNRKSAVFAEVLEPVQQYEQEELERQAPLLAEAASAHRMLEGALKHAEGQAAKAKDALERKKLEDEAKLLARDLAKSKVPSPPQFFADDITPEKLSGILDEHDGRMLVAAPEGTIFEIIKGRYSEKPNFDVMLKAHAGDPIRVNRVGRAPENIDQPALSMAVAVQLSVISGLAGQASLKGQGFLARMLYSIPVSLVGKRKVGADPVPKPVATAYRERMLALWRLAGGVDQTAKKPVPHVLTFSPDAREDIEDFERWLEPQLGEGGKLQPIADWASKLAGASLRIAGILHVAAQAGTPASWKHYIESDTVRSAIAIARDYLLPHAKAAYGRMGADPVIEGAKHVLGWLYRKQLLVFSRRDAHRGMQTRFQKVDELDPVLDLLCKHGYTRAKTDQERGSSIRPPSPEYEVHPSVLESDLSVTNVTNVTNVASEDP
jgi:DNA primase catalytic core